MAAEIFESLNLIAKTKNLGPEVVVSTLQQSLINAAKKYLNLAKNIEAEIDKDSGEIHVFLRVNIVEDYPDVDPALTPEEVTHEEVPSQPAGDAGR